MTDQRNPAEHVLDLLVYAPLGLLADARTLLPDLAAKGRMRVGNARIVGQFAVQVGQSEAEKRIGKLEEHARRSLTEFGLLPPEPAAAPMPTADARPEPPGTAVPAAPILVSAPPATSATKPPAAPRRATQPSKPASKRSAPKAPASRAPASKAPAPKSRTKGPAARRPAAKPSRSAGRAAAVPSGPPAAGSLAIPDYDNLAASQVVSRLDGLRPAELAAVQQYELATRGRKTILGKVAQLQAG